LVIRLPVFIAHVAPVAFDVPLDELDSRLAGLFERCKGTGRGDDLAERQLRMELSDHRRSFSIGLKNAGCFGVLSFEG
jgi:hypothetical protein